MLAPVGSEPLCAVNEDIDADEKEPECGRGGTEADEVGAVGVCAPPEPTANGVVACRGAAFTGCNGELDEGGEETVARGWTIPAG